MTQRRVPVDDYATIDGVYRSVDDETEPLWELLDKLLPEEIDDSTWVYTTVSDVFGTSFYERLADLSSIPSSCSVRMRIATSATVDDIDIGCEVYANPSLTQLFSGFTTVASSTAFTTFTFPTAQINPATLLTGLIARIYVGPTNSSTVQVKISAVELVFDDGGGGGGDANARSLVWMMIDEETQE